MNDIKMDELLDHDYDGIHEYDNPMPGWWVAIFWATIIFAAAYFVWYHAPVEGRSIYDNYQEAQVADLRLQFKDIGELKPLEAPGELIAAWAHDDKFLKIGQAVFKSNCVSCHGNDGQGLIGPNLTDDKYKNIKTITDLPKIISNGANNGAMPAWKNRILPNEVAVVAAYVASLRGQNLPGISIAGEQEIPPWPQPAASKPAK